MLSIVVVLALIHSVLAVDGCTRTAVVQAGDTCDSISRQYGVSTFQLALVNEASIDENCDNLNPGDTVCLGVEGVDCTKVYTVVEDDTCDGLIGTYGMSNDTLYSNNPQIDAPCDNIYVGEVLCVDTNAFSYPTYNDTLYQVLAWTYVPLCPE
ncbi:hypothetical protein TREMEDRAFT_57084 [Tremella mesenterica DSM 1558]|uniref:uncharacterized protein n=1 Tax=Tremella mesenterica (strain ATCC 24925 / CBS 8224 / DSM 1558 / NBRC 9311 / NRRL Y-6157 / RJB 2259-6 / UBC 559-6) TaxID=578456 RepID=UPI0003F4A291|nr:uncharacterized protein TREMEDRAFT_57084 [Tremella mesenterica DSM 1558]EIW69077.1 hypothetical protein TREMEDRAFT_57084 [Tremella mesenterica DSM 1558]